MGAAIYGSRQPGAPMLYLHMPHADAEALAARVSDVPVTLAVIEGADWNRDLTPWPGPSIFRGQPDFGGGGGAHLRRLTEEIIPEAEAGLAPGERWIGGYSLAGLFALWAGLSTPAFSGVMTVSGSLWYAGFLEFVEKSERVPEWIYCSVGDRERLGRNAAFRSIEDCTRETARILARRGARTAFELNPGGHFDDPAGRMERGIRWLLRQEKHH